MIEFTDDDAGYLRWVAENPTGFVVNCERNVRPTYLVLHRAACGHISSAKRTNYTTETYIKVCAGTSEELEAWAMNEAGGELTPCSVCAEIRTAGTSQTQRVTSVDLKNGRIRIPRAAKGIFPPQKSAVALVLRGEELSATWDPRLGPDKERSGVLKMSDGAALRRLVRPDERLSVQVEGERVRVD